ncbi:hypothetical protein VTO42DRAFT_6835 [Malbranchea cinnamomea]
MTPLPSALSASVPLTQNTAPVIKFQCLFTYDIRRKAKRWQDGFLRFHTFNKRIMVYDTSSTFVGDLHWQATEELQEGDELELERGGVLVQVGELLERTETNLTPLLERNKSATKTTAVGPRLSKTAASPPRQVPTSNGSSVVQYPADRLKSLNEVLGIKRAAPIGRAVLPTKSPLEQRQERREMSTEISQRPSKRLRRTSNDDEEEDDTVEQSSTAAVEKRASTSTPVLFFQPASMVKITGASSSSKSRQSSSNKGSSGRQKSITDAFSVDTSITALRFPTHKPRNKLMCMELLSASAEKRTKQPKDQAGPHEKQETPGGSNTDSLSVNPNVGNTTHSTNALSKDTTSSSTNADEPLEFFPSITTIQALEEASAIRPPSSQRDMMISDFFKSSRPAPLPPEPPGNESAHRDTSTAQTRTLDRSRSDTSSLMTSTTTVVVTTTDAPAASEIRRQQAQPARPRSPGRHLQKSASDASSLRYRNSSNHPTTNLLTTSIPVTTAGRALDSPFGDDDEEQGPWTSEALDLFDWWPPGRPKPAPKPRGIRSAS